MSLKASDMVLILAMPWKTRITRMEQILVSEDCTQQSEHIDTKKLQASMSRSLIILEDAKRSKKCHSAYFHFYLNCTMNATSLKTKLKRLKIRLWLPTIIKMPTSCRATDCYHHRCAWPVDNFTDYCYQLLHGLKLTYNFKMKYCISYQKFIVCPLLREHRPLVHYTC